MLADSHGVIKLWVLWQYSFMLSPRYLYISAIAGCLCLLGLLWLDKVVAAIEYPAAVVSVFSVLTELGNTMLYVLLCIVLLLLGRRSLAESLFIAAAVSALASRSLKVLFGRARPFVDDAGAFTFLEYQFAYTSFPSGHSVMAAVFACVLVRFFPALWPVALLLALAVGVSRIVLGVHFLSDVIMGWYIGTACASYVLWRLRT